MAPCLEWAPLLLAPLSLAVLFGAMAFVSALVTSTARLGSGSPHCEPLVFCPAPKRSVPVVAAAPPATKIVVETVV